ncbi:MAG: endonuclease III domain-containing protein [Kiritimatiellaeota bacterium]|nr:endonuclease III domain-containing protein [Kiritimatiellota bacterium]
MTTLERLYANLLEAYGPQGWWPVLDFAGTNPTKTGSVHGYHPGRYDFPRNERERFEICVGAILTQNTAWPNVEQALRRLKKAGRLTPNELLAIPLSELKVAIRPSGYYNVKAKKLLEFTRFYLSLHGRTPTRAELLEVWGVGPETADSIRLYAYGELEMVVDAYTRRFLSALRLAPPEASLEQVRAWCGRQLPPSVPAYQEFHALMVEHGKRCYSRKPYRDALFGAGAVNG